MGKCLQCEHEASSQFIRPLLHPEIDLTRMREQLCLYHVQWIHQKAVELFGPPTPKGN